MRIVLQHIKSSLYFQAAGSWTREFSEAFDFGHSLRAMDYVRQYRLTGVAVVVAFLDADEVETHTFPIESPAPMRQFATAA